MYNDLISNNILFFQKHLAPTPWSKILSTPAVWALIAVEIGFDWGNYTVASDLPKYMNDVLHFTAEEVSFNFEKYLNYTTIR